MSEKKKRIREKIGQVFQIPLGEGVFGYGQVVDQGTSAFFDYQDYGSGLDIKSIIEKPVLFFVGVYEYAIKDGLWPVLGVLPVNPFHQEARDVFTCDLFTKKYTLWTFRKGQHLQVEVPAEDIQNLECLSVWAHDHVEQRLRDHFAGRPNYWYEEARNAHTPNFPGIEEFYKQYGYDFKLPASFEK